MITGQCEVISHETKLAWLKWLDEKESAAKKARADFEDIEGAYILTLYDAELMTIAAMHSFIYSLPAK